MARVLLVALAWCVVRGEDYGGGAMPHYGGPGADYEVPARGAALADDYRGHSLDAPAPLDYKYEEDAHGDTDKPPKYDEVERWRRPERKQRPSREDTTEHVEHDVDPESREPKIKSGHRHSRRKERTRNKSSRRDTEVPRRHGSASARGKHDDDGMGLGRRKFHDRGPDYIESNEYSSKEKKYQEDEDSVTTARVIRRKPRDRVYVPPPVETPLIRSDEDESAGEHIPKDEWNENRERFGPRSPDSSELESGSDVGPRPRIKSKYRNYQEYGDYYDMKRVNSIKNKLPTILHRTSMLPSSPRTPSDLVQALYPSGRAGARSSDDEGPMRQAGQGGPTSRVPIVEDYPSRRSNVKDEILSARSDIEDELPTRDPILDDIHPTRLTGLDNMFTSRRPALVSELPYRRSGVDIGIPIRRSGAIDEHPTRSPSSPAVTHTSTVSPAVSLTIQQPSVIITIPPLVKLMAKNASELSLAEKSRLSILKKAQMKEKVKIVSTKKPPVLLQVNDKAPTVVMVEPGTTENPWMRAREVSDDSPETLEKVKQLMRMKLVANAKSIRELTDDWDQLVCDYIDTGMLDQLSAQSLTAHPLNSLFAFSVTFCYVVF